MAWVLVPRLGRERDIIRITLVLSWLVRQVGYRASGTRLSAAIEVPSFGRTFLRLALGWGTGADGNLPASDKCRQVFAARQDLLSG